MMSCSSLQVLSQELDELPLGAMLCLGNCVRSGVSAALSILYFFYRYRSSLYTICFQECIETHAHVIVDDDDTSCHSLKQSIFRALQRVFSSVQSQSCLTLCNPMDCSTPGFPVHHQLPELTQTHAFTEIEYIPGTLAGFKLSKHIIPTTTLRYCYYVHFMDVETEAQKNKMFPALKQFRVR